ncbi:hypothetical protein M427DRAFT_68559 [Gonapodya prolifera JEL478]|uniref:SH3 domain-containing protein n=1 Tax=Gonapodya prolifera (strain JEL478) TaxID=1344416 RepID=A0A139AKV0_GONPJ|nr:hypothetical protein M427DRAFT_68559 [Gonapodya prolifera JEL478]|eukprot:KXS17123.1 hypothetical protein M427DRAFT_68559 [Gonapodya prolifera JEL478]
MEVYPPRSRYDGGYAGNMDQPGYHSYGYSSPQTGPVGYSSRAASPAKSTTDSGVALPRNQRSGKSIASEVTLGKESKSSSYGVGSPARSQKYGYATSTYGGDLGGRESAGGSRPISAAARGPTRASGFESVYQSSMGRSARDSRASDFKETYSIPITDEMSDTEQYSAVNPYLNPKAAYSASPSQTLSENRRTSKPLPDPQTYKAYPPSTPTLAEPPTSPLSPTQPTLFAVTIFAYFAERADELNFAEGEIVRVHKTPEGGWWYGSLETFGEDNSPTDSTTTAVRRSEADGRMSRGQSVKSNGTSKKARRGWFPCNHTAYYPYLPDEKPTFSQEELEALRLHPNSDQSGMQAIMNDLMVESVNVAPAQVQAQPPMSRTVENVSPTPGQMSNNTFALPLIPDSPPAFPQYPVAAPAPSQMRPDDILYRTLLSQIPGLLMSSLDPYGNLVLCEKNCSVTLDSQSPTPAGQHKSSKQPGSLDVSRLHYDPAVVFLLERAVVVIAPEGAYQEAPSSEAGWGKLKKSKTIGHLPQGGGGGGAPGLQSTWKLVELAPLHRDLVEVREQVEQPPSNRGLFGLGGKAPPQTTSFLVRYAVTGDTGALRGWRKLVVTMSASPGSKVRSEDRVKVWVDQVKELADQNVHRGASALDLSNDGGQGMATHYEPEYGGEGQSQYVPASSMMDPGAGAGYAPSITVPVESPQRNKSQKIASTLKNHMRGMSFDARRQPPPDKVLPMNSRGVSVDVRRPETPQSVSGSRRPKTSHTFHDTSELAPDREQGYMMARKGSDAGLAQGDRVTRTVENLIKKVVGEESGQREEPVAGITGSGSGSGSTSNMGNLLRKLSRKASAKSEPAPAVEPVYPPVYANGATDNGWSFHQAGQPRNNGQGGNGSKILAGDGRARTTTHYGAGQMGNFAEFASLATSVSAPGGLADSATVVGSAPDRRYMMADGSDIVPGGGGSYSSSPGVIVMRRSSHEVDDGDMSETEREYLDLLRQKKELDARLKDLESRMLRSKMVGR